MAFTFFYLLSIGNYADLLPAEVVFFLTLDSHCTCCGKKAVEAETFLGKNIRNILVNSAGVVDNISNSSTGNRFTCMVNFKCSLYT